MNPFKVLSLILFFAPAVEAQPALPLPLADSIWHIWQNETREDSTRFQTIYDYAWDRYLFTQPGSAFFYSQLQYDFAKTRDLKNPMAVAFMAAGGLPTPNQTHARDVAHAALEMAQVVEKGKAKKIREGLPFFEIRIGIHTGPVVVGIVGVKKFQYDIWGDTVNTASRMESGGEVGKLNVSEPTYEMIKDDFTCEYRGELEVKGKEKLRMYFINGV